MHGTARFMWALPLVGALVLAACGGGGDGSPAKDQSFLNAPIGEPRSVLVTSSFIDRAQRESCADEVNRLVSIDGKYVFWNRSGRCADNGYAYRLFGTNAEELLCSQSDSIAGPRTSCTDDRVRAMFETITKNLDQPDLGLGAAHKIEKIDFLPAKPPYKDLDLTGYSKLGRNQNKVIRDLNEWLAFWPTHSEAAVPKIDFTTHMVIGVFMDTWPNGCFHTRISDISRQGGQLVVTRTDQLGPTQALQACTQSIVSPAHLVVLERSAEPVEFVVDTRIAPVREPSQATQFAAGFLDMARREICADEHNRLVVIDQKYVFWNRAGRCGDSSYAYRLYGATPQALLCSQADSIAGPQTSCTDDTVRAMFETIVKNLDQPDLGLGAGHQVEQVDFVPYTDVDVSSNSKVASYENKVIRDLDTWLAFWPAHSDAAVPKIDFNTHMVVGIFMGMKPNGCYRTAITDISRQDGWLVVTRLDRGEVVGPDIACTTAFVSPAHLVVLERSAEPVRFVVKTAQ